VHQRVQQPALVRDTGAARDRVLVSQLRGQSIVAADRGAGEVEDRVVAVELPARERTVIGGHLHEIRAIGSHEPAPALHRAVDDRGSLRRQEEARDARRGGESGGRGRAVRAREDLRGPAPRGPSCEQPDGRIPGHGKGALSYDGVRGDPLRELFGGEHAGGPHLVREPFPQEHAVDEPVHLSDVAAQTTRDLERVLREVPVSSALRVDRPGSDPLAIADGHAEESTRMPPLRRDRGGTQRLDGQHIALTPPQVGEPLPCRCGVQEAVD
jgi:hypothetical protein